MEHNIKRSLRLTSGSHEIYVNDLISIEKKVEGERLTYKYDIFDDNGVLDNYITNIKLHQALRSSFKEIFK